MSIWDFIVAASWGYAIYKVLSIVLTPRVSAEKVDAMIKQIDEMVHVVAPEVHDGITYWFDKHNSQFIAQGETLDDIIKVLKVRFPKHVFLINKEEMVQGPDFKLMKIEELTR